MADYDVKLNRNDLVELLTKNEGIAGLLESVRTYEKLILSDGLTRAFVK